MSVRSTKHGPFAPLYYNFYPGLLSLLDQGESNVVTDSSGSGFFMDSSWVGNWPNDSSKVFVAHRELSGYRSPVALAREGLQFHRAWAKMSLRVAHARVRERSVVAEKNHI